MNPLNLRLAPPGERVLVAVSGGRDSMGLLEWLHRAGTWELVVAHVDHHMRPESPEEALWVSSEAAKRGLPFVGLSAGLVPRGETQARQERYRLLAECAKDRGSSYVAVAHHKRDQLETRLLNILRGTSPAGLAGMRAQRELVPGVILIRPALDAEPARLHEAAPQWREDSSNALGSSPRHILRRDVLPLVDGLMALDTSLALERLARMAVEDEDLLACMVPQAQVLSLKDFKCLHPSLQRRWLRGSMVLSADQVEAALERVVEGSTVDAGGGLTLDVTGGIVSRRERLIVK
ncbi:MAG: tRNA lysidine(34) synthetase TilS [Planctomycetota bacterium]